MNPDSPVWIDLEMTGLDASKDRIIEMATIITDSELNLIAEGPVLAIQQPQPLLDAWTIEPKSSFGFGLLEFTVEEGVSEREAEAVSLAFIEQHVAPNEAPLVETAFGRIGVFCRVTCQPRGLLALSND